MSDSGRRAFMDVLSSEDRAKILSHAHTIRAGKGQMILARGEGSRQVLVVQEGTVETVIYSGSGREVSLRTLGPGQLFGELAAIDGQIRSASVMASSPARLLVIASEDFRALLLGSPEAADWVIRRLARQVRGLTNRVFELSALRVHARLHCELVRLYRQHGAVVDPAPTHGDLANRIGTHREAITRELGALAGRGLVRSKRGSLEFLDPAGLEDELRTILLAPVEDEDGW